VSTSSTSDAESSTAVLTTATTDEPSGTCAADGGICVGADTCVQQGGSIAPSSPGGCTFDDVEAECCVPPPPKPGATTCTDTGGVCAPIGGCLAVDGYITSIDDGCEFQGLYACCVPHDRCGDQTIECCDGDAVFNPVCDDGVFACTAGDPVPIGTCL
jgi:hypothetical protein